MNISCHKSKYFFHSFFVFRVEKQESRERAVVEHPNKSTDDQERVVERGMQALDKVAEGSEYAKKITMLKKEIEKAYDRAKLWPPIEWGKHPNLRSFYGCVRDGFTQFSKLDPRGGWCYLKNPNTNEERAFMLVVSQNAYRGNAVDSEESEEEKERKEDERLEKEHDLNLKRSYDSINSIFRPSETFKELVRTWSNGRWRELRIDTDETANAVTKANRILSDEIDIIKWRLGGDDLNRKWVYNFVLKRFANDIGISEYNMDEALPERMLMMRSLDGD